MLNQMGATISRTPAATSMFTPKRGRDAAHGGDGEAFEHIFLAHMEEPEALLDLGEALAHSRAQPSCLLCLERDPENCHRLIVANRMARASGQEVRHLFVAEAPSLLGIETVVLFSTNVSVTTVEGRLILTGSESSAKRAPFALTVLEFERLVGEAEGALIPP